MKATKQITAVLLSLERDVERRGKAYPFTLRELASRIPGAELKMYPQWGHGLYEEAKDFLPVMLDFLRK